MNATTQIIMAQIRVERLLAIIAPEAEGVLPPSVSLREK